MFLISYLEVFAVVGIAAILLGEALHTCTGAAWSATVFLTPFILGSQGQKTCCLWHGTLVGLPAGQGATSRWHAANTHRLLKRRRLRR